ncbi:MAG: protein-L-isoaspartate(D-aspartate) O-methyltransferase [Nevskiales bacterium]
MAPLRSDGLTEAQYRAQRMELMKEIEADALRTAFETGRKQFGERVMAALREVPRHRFVPAIQRGSAYDNRPLPIGHGQTISQPYIVALMTDLLDSAPEHRVLEIGTGSGYQAAVLAKLVRQVYSIEIIQPLGEQAAKRLREEGYGNVTVRIGDGYYGWPEQAPFDGIVVTAAASSIPPPLVEQLKPGGRMIIPVGGAFFVQYLILVQKDAAGQVRSQQVLPVRFVPLTGDDQR